MPDYAPDDQWMWVAYYEDGTHIAEHDDGRRRGFAEVEIEHVTSLAALSLLPQGRDVLVMIDRKAGMRPIMFRRRRIEFDTETSEMVAASSVMFLGWQLPVGGRSIKMFLRLYPNGAVIATDHDDQLEGE